MGMMTFVVEFEDGKEPSVHSKTQVLGGKVVSVEWSDYRDDHFSEDERDLIAEALQKSDDSQLKQGALHRLDLLTS